MVYLKALKVRRLYAKVLEEVIETMERQLSEVSYFRQSGNEAHQINEDKL